MKTQNEIEKKNLKLETALSFIRRLKELISINSHSWLLSNILGKLEPVDFVELSGVDEAKIKEKHYIVLAISNLIEQIKNNGYGISNKNGAVNLFDGGYWKAMDQEEITDFLGEAALRMGLNPIIAKYFGFKKNLLRQFISDAHFNNGEVSNKNVLINLKNGTLEFSEQGAKLREFRQSDDLFYQLPYRYIPEANAPVFLEYLNTVVPDNDSRKVLQEYIGYIFIKTSILKLEKILILTGSGGNGKSVIHDIVHALLGDMNVSSFALSSLTDEKGFHRAQLQNKLLNYSSEISREMKSELFRQLVSGEPIGARSPYGIPFTMRDYAKLIFNCNALPKIDHTHASLRRFIIIDFNLIIPEHKQNNQFAKKIIESEMPGILNWAIEGLTRLLQQKKFTESKEIARSVKELGLEADNAKRFIEDTGYVKSTSNYLLLKTLYIEYRQFCIDEGYAPLKKSDFKKRLHITGVTIEKRNVGNVVFLEKIKK